MHSRSHQRCMYLGLGVVLLAPLGCAQVDLMTWMRGIPEASAKNPVFNIVSVWEPSEGRNVEGMPSRGFAGQLFFFTRSSPTPVKVNGNVRVYVFDDQGTFEEQAKPIHQFDFLGDAWTMHLQDSTLGPSYNVFVPYTREGEWQANCQLRLRLTSESGEVVYSDTVDVALPGPSSPHGAVATQAAEPTSTQLVGQQLAAEMLPPVETIQYGATLRQQTITPTTANSAPMPASLPMQPMAQAMAAPPQATAAQAAPKRFQLAANNTLPSAQSTLPSAQTTLPSAETTPPSAQSTLPSAPNTLPSARNTLPSAGNVGAKPGNWAQIGRPIIATPPGSYQTVAAVGSSHGLPSHGLPTDGLPTDGLPTDGLQRNRPVAYHISAPPPANTQPTNARPANARPANPVPPRGVGPHLTGHPLGAGPAIRHPLADALQ